MNSFDLNIISFLNTFAHRSWFIDKVINNIGQNDLFKGGLIIPLLWWIWFSNKNGKNEREYVVSTIVASLAGIFIARSLALVLPMRLRPIHNEAIMFQIPYGGHSTNLEFWSSFPSDHAVFFFALATGISFASRRLGLFAFIHAFFVICLSRIYLGFHYPTDIIVGACIGICLSYITSFDCVRIPISRKILIWELKHPSSFYVCFFILSYQMVILFLPIRELGKSLFEALKYLF
jgi:undecaprenyl-diphosphatase